MVSLYDFDLKDEPTKALRHKGYVAG